VLRTRHGAPPTTDPFRRLWPSPGKNPVGAPDVGAEYCDVRVCLSVRVCVSVCLRDRISGTARPIFTKCFVHVTYGRRSDLL